MGGRWSRKALPKMEVPSGYVKIAIENDHLYPFIVDFPMKHGGSFHSLEATPICWMVENGKS